MGDAELVRQVRDESASIGRGRDNCVGAVIAKGTDKEQLLDMHLIRHTLRPT